MLAKPNTKFHYYRGYKSVSDIPSMQNASLAILAGAILKFILHGTAIDQNFNLSVKEYFSNK